MTETPGYPWFVLPLFLLAGGGLVIFRPYSSYMNLQIGTGTETFYLFLKGGRKQEEKWLIEVVQVYWRSGIWKPKAIQQS
jgi:hypothetical protein